MLTFIHSLEISQGIRNLPGSPSFLGNLFKMTAEQCSFIEVRTRQGSLEVRATSLDYGSFTLSRLEDMEEETEGCNVLERGVTTEQQWHKNWSCDWVQDLPEVGGADFVNKKGALGPLSPLGIVVSLLKK
ncbi:hypothetical protein Tco_0461971 [Tanacetum coccineum]